MIYEFLYKTKPTDISNIIIGFIVTLGFFGFFLFVYFSSRSIKPKTRTSSTYGYDPETHKHVVVSRSIVRTMPKSQRSNYEIFSLNLSFLLSLIFLITSTCMLYDHVTTPNENTKTTDLYRITKEKDYLTFTAKKPYNHLYKTKTMKITYTNSGEYVIVTENQTYKVPKELVKE